MDDECKKQIELIRAEHKQQIATWEYAAKTMLKDANRRLARYEFVDDTPRETSVYRTDLSRSVESILDYYLNSWGAKFSVQSRYDSDYDGFQIIFTSDEDKNTRLMRYVKESDVVNLGKGALMPMLYAFLKLMGIWEKGE